MGEGREMGDGDVIGAEAIKERGEGGEDGGE